VIMVTESHYHAIGDEVVAYRGCGVKTPGNVLDFGYSLTRGNFDASGTKFLTVGIPGYVDGTTSDAGAIAFFQLNEEDPTGAAPTCMMFITQGALASYTDVFDEEPQEGARLGHVLLAGNLACDATASGQDCTSADTLAIGLPYVDLDGATAAITDAGAVLLLPSEADRGPSLSRLVTLREGLEGGHLGTALDGDMFGEVLYLLQTNIGPYANPHVELFIGYPHDDTRTDADVGAVAVYAGSRAVGRGDLRFLQPGRTGNPLSADPGQLFGTAFAAGEWVDLGDSYKDWVFSAISTSPQFVWEAH